jgi:hypothetical protein
MTKKNKIKNFRKKVVEKKNCNLCIPRPPLKGRPSSEESSVPQRRTSNTSKYEISSLFSLLDPDPHSQ